MRWFKAAGFGSSTIFTKILVVFMLVITPLCVLSLFINAKGEAAVKREIDKSLSARTSYFMGSLETEITRMIQHQKEFVLDKDLQRLVYLDDTLGRYEWGETILRIQEKMQIIKTSSSFIQNVSVQLLAGGTSISSELTFNALDHEAVNGYLKQYQETGSSVIYVGGRLLLGYVNPVDFLTKKQPDYVIFIELSVGELRKALAQFANYEDSGAALIDLNKGWSVSSGKDESITRNMFEMLDFHIGSQPAQSGTGETAAQLKTLTAESRNYLVSYQYSPQSQMVLIVYVSEKQVLGDLDSYRTWFWLLSVLSMLIIAVFALWIYRLIHKPLGRLILSFRKVEDGYLEPTTLPRSQDEFLYLFEHFNSMVTELKELIHKLSEQEVRAKGAELKQLQSQINPHFLYNTYFILHRLAKMDDIESVVLFSRYLGEYFQFITRNGSPEIPLEQEIKHARLYVEIQQIRFSNRIDVEFDPLPEGCRELPVPKLIVQPIIENAYKYGMEGKKDSGLIRVTIGCGETVTVAVEDNGAGMDDASLQLLQAELDGGDDGGEITGIRNVHRRLQLKFGRDSGIRLQHGGRGGLRVEIVIRPERPALPDSAQ